MALKLFLKSDILKKIWLVFARVSTSGREMLLEQETRRDNGEKEQEVDG